jgi:hypothetical protein
VSLVAGVGIFLFLLFLAVNVLLNLYAASVVNAAAFDAARTVAGSDGGPGAQLRAEAEARQVLGRRGDDATFAWSIDDEEVTLQVAVDNPSLLGKLGAVMPFDDVVRTVHVRRECFRPGPSVSGPAPPPECERRS